MARTRKSIGSRYSLSPPAPVESLAAPARTVPADRLDVTQRQLRGNPPQAFVQALPLECAATLPCGG